MLVGPIPLGYLSLFSVNYCQEVKKLMYFKKYCELSYSSCYIVHSFKLKLKGVVKEGPQWFLIKKKIRNKNCQILHVYRFVKVCKTLSCISFN